jgi:hypothetical protein
MLTAAVEGPTDEVALRRILSDLRIEIGTVYVTNGKPALLRRLEGFNAAAFHAPWAVLVDLNGSACAPSHLGEILPSPAPMMTCRVVVRALESWIMGDVERLAPFLGVSQSMIPEAPDAEPDPKEALVNLARRSRKRAIRLDMVPRPGGGRKVGPAYEARLIEFLSHQTEGWRPLEAAMRSESLKRCLAALCNRPAALPESR